MACFDVRRPTLSCLNSEQSEHCGGHVVVVELLLGPHPGHHHWRFAPVSELKKLSLNQVFDVYQASQRCNVQCIGVVPGIRRQ